jgi:hypothetical protein
MHFDPSLMVSQWGAARQSRWSARRGMAIVTGPNVRGCFEDAKREFAPVTRAAFMVAAAALALFLGAARAETAEPKELHYTAESELGLARLTIRPATASLLLSIDTAPGRRASIDMQAALLTTLLCKFLSEHNAPSRLFIVFKDTSELFQRIGGAALEGSGWDSARGQPRSGSVGKFIVDEINTRHLAAEIEKSLASARYELKAKSAEEIIVGPLGDGRNASVPLSGVVGFTATRLRAK